MEMVASKNKPAFILLHQKSCGGSGGGGGGGANMTKLMHPLPPHPHLDVYVLGGGSNYRLQLPTHAPSLADLSQ